MQVALESYGLLPMVMTHVRCRLVRSGICICLSRFRVTVNVGEPQGVISRLRALCDA